MTKKKVLFSVLAFVVLIAGLYYFNWLSAQGDFTPLTDAQKADFSKEYNRLLGNYYELVWFEENGGKRDDLVHRYFGTYGDCYVFLRYMTHDMALQELKGPLPIVGLPRAVVSPAPCEIYLYNTSHVCKTDEYIQARYMSLFYMRRKNYNWLTDAQIEQLTKDLEAWIAKGNC